MRIYFLDAFKRVAIRARILTVTRSGGYIVQDERGMRDFTPTADRIVHQDLFVPILYTGAADRQPSTCCRAHVWYRSTGAFVCSECHKVQPDEYATRNMVPLTWL